MRRSRFFSLAFPAVFCLVFCLPVPSFGETLRERNEVLLQNLQKVHGLSASQMEDIRDIFTRSGTIGQGNPEITKPPLTKDD